MKKQTEKKMQQGVCQLYLSIVVVCLWALGNILGEHSSGPKSILTCQELKDETMSGMAYKGLQLLKIL